MIANFERTARTRDRLIADLSVLANDAEHLLKATAGDVSDAGRELRGRLSETVARAKATCNDLQAQTLASTKSMLHQVDDAAREHPYHSIGIAFGLGVLIGVLVARQ